MFPDFETIIFNIFFSWFTLKFEDKEPNEKRSYFEINYATVVKLNENIEDKKTLEKILLCDVQKDIYPNIEASFLNLLHNSIKSSSTSIPFEL